jgi:hypothetical protein
MWLISIEDHHIGEFITLQKQMEENLHEMASIRESVAKERSSKANKTLKQDTIQLHPDQQNEERILTHIMLPTTRAMASQRVDSTTMPSRKRRAVRKSINKVHEEREDHSKDQPTIKPGGIKWKRIPKEPIPQLSEISTWVGKQLWHENMPKKYQHMHPEGKLITMDSSYPEGLLAVPNAEGQPRIIVPPTEIKALILQTHEDIHHQNHVKVMHVLKA